MGVTKALQKRGKTKIFSIFICDFDKNQGKDSNLLLRPVFYDYQVIKLRFFITITLTVKASAIVTDIPSVISRIFISCEYENSK